jgi:hypothetical protein
LIVVVVPLLKIEFWIFGFFSSVIKDSRTMTAEEKKIKK